MKVTRKRESAVRRRKPAPVAARRGRHRSLDARKPSHVPLNTEERAKLGGAAAAMGLPYATWARMTLLAVAEWPTENQPIRMTQFAKVDFPGAGSGDSCSVCGKFLEGVAYDPGRGPGSDGKPRCDGCAVPADSGKVGQS